MDASQPLTPDDREFKRLYRSLDDKPLQPGDPMYEPVYAHEGCDDPVDEMQRRIKYSDVESVTLFSGFRGAGKTTELLRLRERLEKSGATVLYADALKYIAPATPVEITDLLIILAGAFSDALAELHIDIAGEGYWTRLKNTLINTEVGVKELGLKGGADGAGADLKLEVP